MQSEKLKTEDLHALEWYACMGVDVGIDDLSSAVIPAKAGIQMDKSRIGLKNNNDAIILDPRLRGDDKLECGDAIMWSRDEKYTLESLKSAVLNFDGCDLKHTATNTVFGDGVPTSKIMLIGEAPGATEDAQGIPFCGESGKLLDNMIASIGLSRTKNVYITNTIFWRPPGNRAPTDKEIEACRPFVEQHIALIDPELLILVGSTAVTSLLGKHLQISRIRQEYYQYTNKYLDKHITTTALFHPAYLLRQPMQKKTTWYDLLKIREFIEKNIKTC